MFKINLLTMKTTCLILFLFFSAFCVCAVAQPDGTNWKSEYEKLKKEHDALVLDRDNIVAQTKKLIKYKNKVRDVESTMRQLDIEKEKLAAEKEEAAKELEELKAQVASLDEQLVVMKISRDEYKKSFEKASSGNIIEKETKEQIRHLGQENQELSKKNRGLEFEISKLKAEILKKSTQIDVLTQKLDEVRAKYKVAGKKNRALERKLKKMPKKFSELARENRVLIKRTSTMHYNLGVFYTKNGEYPRAIAEFEKAVELNPEDSASYFNLGYIYAEHLANRPKAIEQFKQFLKLSHAEDKDVDWVKRYILTWETWEGDRPIK